MDNKQKTALRLASLSFSLLVAVLLLNFFRVPLLGLKKGYAAHNFSFNFLFFFPISFISLVLAVLAIRLLHKYRSTWKGVKSKLIVLGLAAPVFLFYLFILYNILN